MTRQPHDGAPGEAAPEIQPRTTPVPPPWPRGNRKLLALVNPRDVLDDPDGIDRLVEMIDGAMRAEGIEVAGDDGDDTPLEQFEERT